MKSSESELNSKYPCTIECQREKLAFEGHAFKTKDLKNIRYFAENYENLLYDLK